MNGVQNKEETLLLLFYFFCLCSTRNEAIFSTSLNLTYQNDTEMIHIFANSKDWAADLSPSILCSIQSKILSLIEYWDGEIRRQEFKYVIIISAEVMS